MSPVILNAHFCFQLFWLKFQTLRTNILDKLRHVYLVRIQQKAKWRRESFEILEATKTLCL